MYNLKLVALISIVSIFAACEGGTTFEKEFVNDSSETITIDLFITSLTSYQDSVVIPPNESKVIFWDDQQGNFTDETYTCLNEIDSVHISVSNGKVLTRDFMNVDNWGHKSEDGRNSKEMCTFTIDDGHLN
jgi:hypothetical protein